MTISAQPSVSSSVVRAGHIPGPGTAAGTGLMAMPAMPGAGPARTFPIGAPYLQEVSQSPVMFGGK